MAHLLLLLLSKILARVGCVIAHNP